MSVRMKAVIVAVFILIVFSCNPLKEKYALPDIVIYGATSAGIIAAVQAKRMGKSVIVISPDNHIGGLTTGGLGHTDFGNKDVVGGITREFYQRIKEYYSKPDHWIWEYKMEYQNGGDSLSGESEDAMWTFEPSAAMSVFKDLIEENEIVIFNNERLSLDHKIEMVDGQIKSIRTESGKRFKAKMFIDATYEGDLMAAAGVSYTLGREPVSEYNESLNGVQTKMANNHQFPDNISPYIQEGNSISGQLPGILANSGKEGSGDRKIQAYCFRMCLTDAPDNLIPIEKPNNYNDLEYELLFRLLDKGYDGPFLKMSMMPNRKTDVNNLGAFSSDYVGRNYEYPKGDYRARKEIYDQHKTYHLGLLWTLANDPRIPENLRKEWQKWGLPKDEFTDNGNWSPQLYIREARRMLSDYVMTQHHCMRDSAFAEQSIGMGAYPIALHHVQRYVDEKGFVKNEGDMKIEVNRPYPIDYRSIIPKQSECTNLFVPVCLSATHVAYGSIRMEPVFMILGQSAAIAACLCIDKQVNSQSLNYTELKNKLEENKQILHLDIDS